MGAGGHGSGCVALPGTKAAPAPAPGVVPAVTPASEMTRDSGGTKGALSKGVGNNVKCGSWVIVVGLALAGCGRLGFDPVASEVLEADAPPDLQGPDAGPPELTLDAAVEAGSDAPCDGLPGALFCDDFENPDISRKWTFSPAVNAPTSSEGNAWKGERSMRGESQGGGAVVTGGAALASGVSEGMLYARVHVLVPAESEMPLRHIDFFDLYGPGIAHTPNSGSLSFSAVGDVPGAGNEGSLLVMSGEFDADGNNKVHIHELTAPNTLPRGRWFCLQVAAKYGEAGSLSVEIDGTRVLELATANTTVPGGYDKVVAPISFTWSGQGKATIFLDELAVGTEPIACATP